LYEISSSHGSEYEAQNLLGCTAVFLIECRPIALMMEAARTSETSDAIEWDLDALTFNPIASAVLKWAPFSIDQQWVRIDKHYWVSMVVSHTVIS
jgi:hypothetical protein